MGALRVPLLLYGLSETNEASLPRRRYFYRRVRGVEALRWGAMERLERWALRAEELGYRVQRYVLLGVGMWLTVKVLLWWLP
jgi:hypothetical protein